MSDKEILEKAIRRAIDGGWQKGYDWLDTIMSDDAPIFTSRLFIFDHDFAKALWGDTQMIARWWFPETETMVSETRGSYPTTKDIPNGAELFSYDEVTPWESHLKNMVIAEDPVKYLGEHLTEKSI